MPPKSKKVVNELSKPVVSEQQLAEAKKVLKDAENKKRFQSNMRFALQQEDVWDRYLVKPMAARKEYLEAWVARQLVSDERYAKQWTGKKSLQSEQATGLGWSWVSKHKLVNEWGEKKFQARKDAGKLIKRADPETGLSDDDNAEFKLVVEQGLEMEAKIHITCSRFVLSDQILLLKCEI